MINFAEILIVNITSAVLLFLLPHIKIADKLNVLLCDRIFTVMRYLAIFALVIEIVTFYIDGHPGKLINILSYLLNGYLFFASAAAGMLWVLYIYFSIYRNSKRISKILPIASMPLFIITVLLAGDMFGLGSIFSITSENIYVRGNLIWISYAVVFLYYSYSIVLSLYSARKSGVATFDAHYFVIPCILGTLVQGMQYGITFGWFSVSIAFILLQMRRQNLNAYIDSLSGLYNRRYYDYFLDKIVRSAECKTLSGIMLDINAFKRINDSFGHRVGDDAICKLSNILLNVKTENFTVFRLSGDEFVFIGKNQSELETQQLIHNLQSEIEAFNKKSGKPYKFSLAIGYYICEVENFNSDDFFNKIDTKMYKSKAAYYEQLKKV